MFPLLWTLRPYSRRSSSRLEFSLPIVFLGHLSWNLLLPTTGRGGGAGDSPHLKVGHPDEETVGQHGEGRGGAVGPQAGAGRGDSCPGGGV